MEVAIFNKERDCDQNKVWEELKKIVNNNKQELQNNISIKTPQDAIRVLRRYFKKIIIWEYQFELNQKSFEDFINHLRKDENPYELLDMIMENNWISVQKMQFLNQHYKELWLHLPYRKETLDEKFENKIPLSLRAVGENVYPPDSELQKDFPATWKVLEKYFLDTPVDDEIQNMIKTKKMLPHYRYLLECYDVSLKGCVDLKEFLKFCYGESQGLQVKYSVSESQTDGEKIWYLHHNSNEWRNITLDTLLCIKNGCKSAIDPSTYEQLAHSC